MSDIEGAGGPCRDAGMQVLPDAPVALLRLDADGAVMAANRAALDLLAAGAGALIGQPCHCVWGLPADALDGEEGVWLAPGEDPARRVRYQRDRDGGGWVLSLPHPETAALLRDVAMLGRDAAPVVGSPAVQPLARRLHQARQEHALLERIGTLLGGCDLDLALPADVAAEPASRRIAAGFGNLAEAIRQAVALSVQIAAEVPHLVGDNDELLRQSQAQVAALESVLESTRRLLQGLQGAGEELQAVISVAASADASARAGSEAAHQLGDAMREVERRAARAGEVIEVIDAVAFQTRDSEHPPACAEPGRCCAASSHASARPLKARAREDLSARIIRPVSTPGDPRAPRECARPIPPPPCVLLPRSRRPRSRR